MWWPRKKFAFTCIFLLLVSATLEEIEQPRIRNTGHKWIESGGMVAGPMRGRLDRAPASHFGDPRFESRTNHPSPGFLVQIPPGPHKYQHL